MQARAVKGSAGWAPEASQVLLQPSGSTACSSPAAWSSNSLREHTESRPSRAARRETGSGGRGGGQPTDSAGNVAPAEPITHGVAALGKGDMGSRRSCVPTTNPCVLTVSLVLKE